MGRRYYRGLLHYFIGSTTRALVIERLFKHPQHAPYFRELGRGVKAGMGALHRELEVLEHIGLLKSSARGGARYYALQPDHPLYEPLRGLVRACEQMDTRR